MLPGNGRSERRSCSQVLVIRVAFKVGIEVIADVTRDTVPDITPAKAVSVDVVTATRSVVSVVSVVSVEMHVVFTVMDSMLTVTDVEWLGGDTENSSALFVKTSVSKRRASI